MAYAASKEKWRKELQSLIKIDMSIHVDLTPNASINADLHAAEHLASSATAPKGFQVPMLGLVNYTDHRSSSYRLGFRDFHGLGFWVLQKSYFVLYRYFGTSHEDL